MFEEVAAVVFDRFGGGGFAHMLAVGGGEEQGVLLVEVGIGFFEKRFDVVEQVIGLFFVASNEHLRGGEVVFEGRGGGNDGG